MKRTFLAVAAVLLAAIIPFQAAAQSAAVTVPGAMGGSGSAASSIWKGVEGALVGRELRKHKIIGAAVAVGAGAYAFKEKQRLDRDMETAALNYHSMKLIYALADYDKLVARYGATIVHWEATRFLARLEISAPDYEGVIYSLASEAGLDPTLMEDERYAWYADLYKQAIATGAVVEKSTPNKKCPDPVPAPDELVTFSSNVEKMAAGAYQMRIGGLPPGLTMLLPKVEPEGGKKSNYISYDGCIEADGILLDAKHGYENFTENGQWKDWYVKTKGPQKLWTQAKHQSQAAAQRGMRVEWHLTSKTFYIKVKALFGSDFPNLTVIYDPV